MTMTAYFNLGAFNGILDRLDTAVTEAVRPAAQAAAQVFYDRVKANVARIPSVSGNLNASIYQKFSPEESIDGKRAVYKISWNQSKAPHGHLLEFGHFVRYKYYVNKKGEYRPMVRPERMGDPKPKRRASQAEKDAYYVPLPVPWRTTAHRFVGRAIDQGAEIPAKAAVAEIYRRINARLEGR